MAKRKGKPHGRKPSPNFHGKKGRSGGRREGAGKPPTPIDYATVENLAGIGATMGEIGAVVGMHEDSLHARKLRDAALAQAIERGRAKGKLTLRRLQWQGAKNGNPTMLIWLGKQMLGQRDQIDVALEDKRPPPDFSNCTSEELATLRAAAAIMKRSSEPLVLEHHQDDDSAENGDDEQAA